MAIPSVISSLVTVVYNMADTFFVGQTGDALQVAAVSLTNPIFILFMASKTRRLFTAYGLTLFRKKSLFLMFSFCRRFSMHDRIEIPQCFLLCLRQTLRHLNNQSHIVIAA